MQAGPTQANIEPHASADLLTADRKHALSMAGDGKSHQTQAGLELGRCRLEGACWYKMQTYGTISMVYLLQLFDFILRAFD
jgi:hypothetical protein